MGQLDAYEVPKDSTVYITADSSSACFNSYVDYTSADGASLTLNTISTQLKRGIRTINARRQVRLQDEILAEILQMNTSKVCEQLQNLLSQLVEECTQYFRNNFIVIACLDKSSEKMAGACVGFSRKIGM